MAKNQLTQSFKKNTLLFRSVEYGTGNYADGRTALQNHQTFFIAKHFGIKEHISNYILNHYLVYIGLSLCGRLLRFDICPLGLYTLSIIPVFGGNNTPFQSIILKEPNQQLQCLEINPLPKQKSRKVKTMR